MNQKISKIPKSQEYQKNNPSPPAQKKCDLKKKWNPFPKMAPFILIKRPKGPSLGPRKELKGSSFKFK